ncbi:sulfite exporter TauE/SafE family protein [Companilactobacillus furfuricola]|uniref:sulfite exporter TauE/SafE family protein n=1 Tax=Companilactobacillus furfuricola TaxID=1462575 RepID=UPI000F79AAD5|nr:sulfite exporter TauE/SafE family protein [Companilactobacillus furfuricola]
MTSISLIIAGIIIGTIVIALGGGGAAFYLGILTAVFHLPPEAAAATSLVTALPSLLIGATTYAKQKRIKFKIGNILVLSALPSVLIGSLLSPYIPEKIYTWIIGLILMILGLRILLKRQSKPKANPNKAQAILYGAIAGLMVGVSGLSGGGMVLAGLILLGLNTFDAMATSTYVLTATSALGALMHATAGKVNWTIGLPLIAGAIIGAILAPQLVKILAKTKHPEYVNYFIAILLIIMGAKSLL